MVDRQGYLLDPMPPLLWQLSSGHYLCFLLIRGKNIANGRFESGEGSTVYPPFSPSLVVQPGQGENSSNHKQRPFIINCSLPIFTLVKCE